MNPKAQLVPAWRNQRVRDAVDGLLRLNGCGYCGFFVGQSSEASDDEFFCPRHRYEAMRHNPYIRNSRRRRREVTYLSRSICPNGHGSVCASAAELAVGEILRFSL